LLYDLGMGTVTRHIELDLCPDALWEAITDREVLEAWLGDTVDIDLRPGGSGVVVDDGVTRRVTVSTFEPGRGWAFDWSVDDEPESRVTFAISTTATGGSELTITETFAAGATASATSASAMRWDLCLFLLWACSVATALAR
jgi:uncharacterized protein YndB with AHSA1/START domain